MAFNIVVALGLLTLMVNCSETFHFAEQTSSQVQSHVLTPHPINIDK